MSEDRMEDVYVPQGEAECEHSRELTAYWSSLCEGGAFPLAEKFDTLDVPELAPWMALVDVVEGGKDYRYRLIGTMLERIFDGDQTGKLFSEEDRDIIEKRLAKIYEDMLARKEPLWVRGRVGNVYGRMGFHAESCVLPLVDDTGAITRVVHMIRIRTDEGRWMD